MGQNGGSIKVTMMLPARPAQLPKVQVVRRCRYCARDMTSLPTSTYNANPFCVVCLPERLENSRPTQGPLQWREWGHYTELVTSAPETPRSRGGRKRRRG